MVNSSRLSNGTADAVRLLGHVLPIAGLMCIVPVSGFAQQILRPTLDATTPQTDENLNGVEDATDQELTEQQERSQPPVVFDTPLQDTEEARASEEQLNNRRRTRTGGQNRDANTRSNSRDSASEQPLNFDDQRADEPLDNNARARRADSVDLLGNGGTLRPLANTPALAEQGGDAARVDDPFAPLGIRAGSFTLFPVLEQTLGYTSNADFAEDGEASGFSQTNARVQFQSKLVRE